MAPDSTTDDAKKNQQPGGNATSASGNTSIDDAAVGLDQPPPQVSLKDFPYSKDTKTEKGNSDVIKKDVLPPCDHGGNSDEILMQERDKPVDIQSKGLADLPEENHCVHSPGALPGDSQTSYFEIQSQKIDGKGLDDPNQDQDSVILKERPLDVKAQPQEVGLTGPEEMDINTGLTRVESSSAIEPNEGNLISEVNEVEEKCLSKEMPALEMVPEDETKKMEVEPSNEVEGEFVNPEQNVQSEADVKTAANMFLPDKIAFLGNESETQENQVAFMKELEAFHKERFLEFKPPKFYGEPLNCLKLWRAVIKLGGYEQVTASKLWRQVGESFNPPKTCTTVSWTFRGFYEKALLEYEKHKLRCGELPFTDASSAEPSVTCNQAGLSQSSGSGRARRDAAARAMQGWHSQRLLGNGEVGDPIIKDKNSVSTPKREKQLKSVGLLKRKKVSPVDHPLHIANLKASKPQLETMVVDVGAPADWVKINVQRTKDCFEVYALVPGLLREEVRVQSDPAGRLVISGQPEQLDNPWGVTPFKKVVSLPSRIDPHQTSAVVTLHGQLFVRVPFEQTDI